MVTDQNLIKYAALAPDITVGKEFEYQGKKYIYGGPGGNIVDISNVPTTPPAPGATTTPSTGAPSPTPPAPLPSIAGITPGATTGIATSDPVRNTQTQQQTDQAAKDAEELAALTRLTRQKAIKDLQVATGAAPETPSLVSTYNNLRTQQGIGDIETELSSIKTQRTGLQQSLQKLRDELSGQGRTAGEVDTAVGVKAKEVQAQLDTLNLRESTLADQYKAKTDVISTIMDLTQKDYSNAKADYDKAYTTAISAINAVKGLQDAQKTEQDRASDNARANLQIMFNQISSGGMTVDKMSPAQKAQINSLELQAGLPVGTIDTFAKMKPKANIISTTSGVDKDGNNIVSIVYADENGKPGIVETVKTGGKSKPPATGTPAETEKTDIASMSRALSRVAGGDGYISPSDYAEAKKNWVAAGYPSKKFDETFSIYRNPANTNYNTD